MKVTIDKTKKKLPLKELFLCGNHLITLITAATIITAIVNPVAIAIIKSR